MSEDKKNTVNDDDLKQTADSKRRKLLKSSLAVPPVAMSIMGKPALGGVMCGLSGQLSGNLSQPQQFQDVCGGQGCTPGFWKTHELWHQDIQPHLFFNQLFEVDVFKHDVTLGQVIGFCGYNGGLSGGSGKIPASYIKTGYPTADCYPNEACLKLVVMLGYHSVAALQNAAESNCSYDMTVAEVIQKTATAYNSNNKATIEAQKDEFEKFNEQFCPLGGGGTNCESKGGVKIDYNS